MSDHRIPWTIPMRLAPLLLLLLAGAACAADPVLLDFEQPGQRAVTMHGESNVIGGSFSFAPAPEQPKGTSLRIAWEQRHQIYLDWSFTGPTGLAEFTTAAEGVVKVQVWSPGFAAMKDLAVRLADAKGEAFQYRLAAKEAVLVRGWHEFAFPITPTGHAGHWGDGGDGLIDLPAHVTGFAFEFTGIDTMAGELCFDGIAVLPKR